MNETTTTDREWPFGEMGTIVGDWVDNVSHLRCVVLVGPLGSLNGYVVVPEEHPWHGMGYSQCPIPCGAEWCDHTPMNTMTVHGSITYAGDEVIDGEWAFGFDCAHSGDLVPALDCTERNLPFREEGVLRGPEWVAAEATRLAHQLAAAAGWES